MINSAEIINFRGYARAKLTECRRVNLIVGENGSGKTSLLEALFLAAGGSVEIALRLRHIRGFDIGFTGSPVEIEEALWRDLFHKFNRKAQVSISLQGTEYRNRALTIKFNDPSVSVHPVVKKAKSDGVVEDTPITFDWIGPKGRRAVVKPVVKDGKIELPSAVTTPEETYFFSANQGYSAIETARRFSELSKTSREEQVLARLRQHFEMVTDLSIELIAGMPMVCAKLANMPEKVPLNLISSGMSKLASILFAIASRTGSVLLIDEIENGIYYRRLPIMWESLLDFCKSTDSQIFASTHSGECISAAAALAEKYPDEFSVIHANAQGKLRQFGGTSFSDAIKEEIEIR